MDRTREFRGIVQATEIPQGTLNQKKTFFGDLVAKQEAARKAVEAAVKTTTYESFKRQGLLETAEKLLRVYRAAEIPPGKTPDERAVADSVKRMVRLNIIKWQKMLTEASKKEGVRLAVPTSDEQREHPQTTPPAAFQAQAYVEDEAQEYKSEETQARKRIVKSISEIGQIVDNISLHVGLQEEMLKRLDDSSARAEFWGKKALEELRKAWDITSGNRKTMFVFFGFWIVLFLLIWLVHK